MVERLKASGDYFAAGAVAYSHGLDRHYGCHVGMRSTLEASRDTFYAGYDAASKDAKARVYDRHGECY